MDRAAGGMLGRNRKKGREKTLRCRWYRKSSTSGGNFSRRKTAQPNALMMWALGHPAFVRRKQRGDVVGIGLGYRKGKLLDDSAKRTYFMHCILYDTTANFRQQWETKLAKIYSRHTRPPHRHRHQGLAESIKCGLKGPLFDVVFFG